MRFRSALPLLLLTATLAAAVAPFRVEAAQLVMVEQPGCIYCAAWNEEIAPAYPKTEAGEFAPLRREQLRALPDSLTLHRPVLFTPTFILVDDGGNELGRLEGYPGDNFFWPMLERMLADASEFTTPKEEN